MELFVSRGLVSRWRAGESRGLCSVWDWRRRGQTQRKLEDVRQKQVRKGGPRVRASVQDAGRGRVHLCGPRAGCWRPASLEGRTGCSCQSPARGVGWRFRGAGSRTGQSLGAPARLSPPLALNFTPAAGMHDPSRRARAGGGGEPGRQTGGVHPAARAAPAPGDSGQVI